MTEPEKKPVIPEPTENATKTPPTTPTAGDKLSINKILNIIYLTFAIGIIVGVIPIFGWILSFVPIVGVVLAHIKKAEAQDSMQDSHFDWQIKTFWVTFAATIIGFFTIPIFGIGILILIARSIWLIYRVVKGWLALYEGKGIYPINWLF